MRNNSEHDATQYAVVTFHSDLDSKSSQFFDNEEQMAQDFGVDDLSEVVCDGKDSTNFNSLRDVADLFTDHAAQDDFKHVFMISDGKPNDDDENGIEASLELKEQDVVIATTLIGCLLYTSPSPRDKRQSRMPSSA